MEDLLPLILFFVFFVLPILERVLKGKQTPPEPPEPRQRPETAAPTRRRELDDGASVTQPELHRARGAEAESADAAADMIPDDLWEILTGERRTRPAPPPEPADSGFEIEPWEVDDEVEPEMLVDEVETFEREQVHHEHRGDAERRDALQVERERAVHTADRAPVRAAPRLKIFDATTVPTAAERHAAFHRRVDAPPVAARAPRARTLGSITSLDAAGLRRAVLLREVLGPPKSLEDPRR